MRKATAAEWILSLTIPPHRAASTVGDLMEDASTRRALWFWSSVFRTALAHFISDLTASPFRMIRLALWGWLAESVLVLLLIFPADFAWTFFSHSGKPFWVSQLFVLGLGPTVITFLVGRIVARKSTGRELPAAFALSLVCAVFWKSAVMNHTPHAVAAVIALCIRPPFAFAGAISFRNKMQRS